MHASLLASKRFARKYTNTIMMSDSDPDECCWLCLGEGKPSGAALRRHCACPRKSHAECLALWQLHSAGRRCASTCEVPRREMFYAQ